MNDQTDIRREIELILSGAPKQEAFEDKLKRTQEELGRHRKMALARTVKWSSLLFAFGMALGMTGMVYWYEQKPKPQPVVHVETRMHPALTDQRVKELRFSLQKLERLKDVHDATLKEAATNQGDIRQMVQRLEVGK